MYVHSLSNLGLAVGSILIGFMMTMKGFVRNSTTQGVWEMITDLIAKKIVKIHANTNQDHLS